MGPGIAVTPASSIGFLFVSDPVSVSGPAAARVAVSHVQPDGPVSSQHPPELTKHGDEMLNVEIRCRLKPQTPSPSCASCAELPRRVLLMITVKAPGLVLIEPLSGAAFTVFYCFAFVMELGPFPPQVLAA